MATAGPGWSGGVGEGDVHWLVISIGVGTHQDTIQKPDILYKVPGKSIKQSPKRLYKAQQYCTRPNILDTAQKNITRVTTRVYNRLLSMFNIDVEDSIY